MTLNSEKSRKSGMGIIASRERKKEFDAAVKEVIRQRKVAQQFQNSIRQNKRSGDTANSNRPSLRRHQSTMNGYYNGGGSEHNNHGQPPLDTSGRKPMMRRATVSTGSNSDLLDLKKVREADRRRSDDGGEILHSGGSINNNNVANRRVQREGATTTKVRARHSMDDLTVSTKNPNPELGGKPVSGSRRNLLNRSMTATDEIRKEVMEAMAEKEEGGFKSYDPISAKKRVASNPFLSSCDEEPTQKESSYERNDSWSLPQDPRATNNSSPTSLCGIPGIRLEDLIPTRNASTSLDGSTNNENRTQSDNSGNSRGRVAEDGVIEQWKSKTLMMFPPQIDFELGNSTPPPPQSEGAVREKTLSGEANNPSSLRSSSTEEHDYGDDYGVDKDCPRRKFASFSSGGGSKSGGTGNTSRGSIFSSTGSLNNEGSNSNPSMFPSIAAIEEEDKPRPPTKEGDGGDEHSLQSTSSRFSLKSLRSRASRRSRRLNYIRKSIRNSLTGGSSKIDGIPLVIGDDGSNSDAVSSEHSQPVDPEKIRRHFLERNASSNSITSAYSSVTDTSTSKKESTPPGWRFRLRKGGFRNQSMSALSIERNRRRPSDSGWSDDGSTSGNSFTDFYDNELHSGMMKSIITKSTSARSLGLTSLPTVDEGEQNNSEKQLNHVEEQKVEIEVPKGDLDASNKSDDTAESFYRHPAHEHPLLHVRPNQLFPQSPGWRCDLCMTDTQDLNEWAYVSTGLNYLLCERCFRQNGEALAK